MNLLKVQMFSNEVCQSIEGNPGVLQRNFINLVLFL